jgi:hypothetical protein
MYPVEDFVLAVKGKEPVRGQASNALNSAPRTSELKKVRLPRRKLTYVAIHRVCNALFYKPADPASHRLANLNILLSLKASASAPAGSVKRKNGSDARLAIKEMKRPDGDTRFIVHVAAVS